VNRGALQGGEDEKALESAPSPLHAPPRLRRRCDEMREQLVNSLKGRVSGRDGSQQSDETVRKFLQLCGDTRRPLDRYLADWVEKYDKAVRKFEEKQQKGEPAAKGPEKEP
jgi:hypothetical protein